MRKAVAVSLLLIVVTAAAAGAVRVKTQIAPGADLSNRVTYRWDKPVGPGPEGLDGKLRAAAEKTMAKRGLRKAAEGDAKVDLVLSYNVGAADQLVSGAGRVGGPASPTFVSATTNGAGTVITATFS